MNDLNAVKRSFSKLNNQLKINYVETCVADNYTACTDEGVYRYYTISYHGMPMTDLKLVKQKQKYVINDLELAQKCLELHQKIAFFKTCLHEKTN